MRALPFRPIPFSFSAMFLACGVLVSGCRSTTYYHALPIPFDDGQLIGSWVGFSNHDGTSWYKLTLLAEGRGIMYSQLEIGTTFTNKITTWQVNDNGLQCKFEDGKSGQDPSTLTATIMRSMLNATLTGVGGWKGDIQFLPISLLEDSLTKAKALGP